MTKVLLDKGELEDEAIVDLFDDQNIVAKSFPPACRIEPYVSQKSISQEKTP